MQLSNNIYTHKIYLIYTFVYLGYPTQTCQEIYQPCKFLCQPAKQNQTVV